MNTNDQRPGMFIEIMTEARNRLDHKVPIEIFSWSRAQELAQNEENIILFPLARLPSRENKYSWIDLVKTIEMRFVSSDFDIKNVAQAQKLRRILVHKNSPPELLLKEKGFNNLVGLTDMTNRIPKMMSAGRGEAWFTTRDMANWIWQGHPELPQPYISPPFSVEDLYIAGSLGLSPEIKRDYQNILKKMHIDGTISNILKRYMITYNF